MIDKKKHLYFAKKVKDEFIHMNVDVIMEVDDVSKESTKAFVNWVKAVNEAEPTETEKADIGIVLEYEIFRGKEHQGVRLSFHSCREENGFDEQTRYEIEKLMNETAIKLDKMINKKDQS